MVFKVNDVDKTFHKWKEKASFISEKRSRMLQQMLLFFIEITGE